MHGIRILPGPSSLWLDATGTRLPVPLFPGFDTLGTLAHIGTTGHEHTWFVLTQKIIEKEFALSGSEQNPDITGKSIRELLQARASAPARPPPVEAFKRHGAGLRRRARPAHARRRHEPADRGAAAGLRDRRGRGRGPRPRDRQPVHARTSRSPRSTAPAATCADRITRVAAPHRLLDPEAGPLIAVKLHILTRKTLGGLHTDLSGRVLRADGEPLPGPVRRGRGRRLRRRRDARLPRARGHLPRRLPVLGPHRRARAGGAPAVIAGAPSTSYGVAVDSENVSVLL